MSLLYAISEDINDDYPFSLTLTLTYDCIWTLQGHVWPSCTLIFSTSEWYSEVHASLHFQVVLPHNIWNIVYKHVMCTGTFSLFLLFFLCFYIAVDIMHYIIIIIYDITLYFNDLFTFQGLHVARIIIAQFILSLVQVKFKLENIQHNQFSSWRFQLIWQGTWK